MKVVDIKHILEHHDTLKKIKVVGWIKTNRDSGKIGFIELNDGTHIKNLQIVFKQKETINFNEIKSFRTGSAIMVEGTIQKSSKSTQEIEVMAQYIKLLKMASEDFPLQKKEHSLEFLREMAHLRPRTQTFTCIMKIRSKLAYAIHSFFQNNNFVWLSSPIISSNDAEGAGENFNLDLVNGKDFFNKQAKLTVSGQLNAEAYAQALKYVYTFGPTFRAEQSHTNRHIAEFWMVEPEIAFINLNQLMMIIETFIKTIIKNLLKISKDELDFFFKQKEYLKKRIEDLINKDFIKITYEEAIQILTEAINKGHKFDDDNVFFGKDLTSEHERYLCEKHFGSPLFIYNYPKEIKAFYMKLNDDEKTVAACDLLVPGIGEIIGGSQREDDYDKLVNRINEMNLSKNSIDWYLNLRKYGYYSSAGFGLGFERLIMYILDLENIRDAIPFPRSNGNLNF